MGTQILFSLSFPWLVLGLLCTSSLLLVYGGSPPFPTFVVDGDPSEWDEYHSSGATDPSVIWNFGWDSDTLYIGLKVPLSGFFDTPSQGKVIVLYFDTTLPTDDEPTNSFGTAQGRLYGDQVTKGRSDPSASLSIYSFPDQLSIIYIIFVPFE